MIAVRKSWSLTCLEEVKVCHTQRGDNSLDVASWTSFHIVSFGCCCCPEAARGSNLNLGGFFCCQTADEMRGYLSLSYVHVCYLYCYEKCFC